MAVEVGEVIQAVLGIGGGAGALAGLGLWLRRYFKGMGLEDAHRASEQASVETNDKVLKNIQEELARHAARIKELEDKVDELTTKLANVRVVAIDCYSLATQCQCEGEVRERLLSHLKQIIKDA